MIKSIVFEGESINLTPVSRNNIDGFYEYSLNNKLYDYFEYEPFTSIIECDKYLDRMIERSKTFNSKYWFIRKNNESQKVIGSVCLVDFNENRRSVEIGYSLSPTYWGKGIAFESLNLLIKNAFEIFNINRISAKTDSENKSSIKLLKKLKFTYEGKLREFYKYNDGRKSDSNLYSLLYGDVY